MFENEYKWMNEQTTYQKHLMESVPKWNQPLSHYIWQRIFFFVCFCFSKWPKYQKYCLIVLVVVVVLNERVSELYRRYLHYIQNKKKEVKARERMCAFVLAYVCGMSDKMEKYGFSGECESHHLNKNAQLQESKKRIIIIMRNLRRLFLFHLVAHTNARERANEKCGPFKKNEAIGLKTLNPNNYIVQIAPSPSSSLDNHPHWNHAESGRFFWQAGFFIA